jgi:hypothetical protein
MNKTNDIKENFSAILRDSLRKRFGRIPSAAVVAREFNLRAYDTSPVSQESARRWLRGVSLPEEERLRVLVNWLNLDFNAALRPRTNGQITASNHHARQFSSVVSTDSDRPDVGIVDSSATPQPLSPHTNGLGTADHEILGLISELGLDQKRALIDLIKLGFSARA